MYVTCVTSDYENLRWVTMRIPLRGVMVSVQQVERPNAIQVHNMAGTSKDTLELYFENTNRSGGGDVKSVSEHPLQGCVVIEFLNGAGE